MSTPRIRRALISVSDKTGLENLARALVGSGVEILSTGGTAKTLASADIPVTQVADHTGFPEIMGGRIKTLHPRIHGGILGRRECDADVMTEHGIAPIDLVVVNLYPFAETVADPDCSLEQGIENIDIGGPAMLRAAAKNFHDVCVVCDPADYPRLIKHLPCSPHPDERQRLAASAFAHTAGYDQQIQRWLRSRAEAVAMPESLELDLTRIDHLRYGENPRQQAALYREHALSPGTLTAAERVQGKPLSYNNLLDADAARLAVGALGDHAPACVIVKHTNPCGAARGKDCREAYERAFACDPTSSFGGIIAINRDLDADTTRAILDNQFLEVLIAPAVDNAAREVLATKPNVRVLATGPLRARGSGLDIKRIDGGWLAQEADTFHDDPDGFRVVTAATPDDRQWADLLFAWQVVGVVRSNAIVYAADLRTVGIGAGQMSRVDSARIAAWKAADAGLRLDGAVMASDAFFPFADSIETAAEHGIRAVIQPGGSRRDDEVVAACDEHGIAMVLTGIRHFRH